MAEGFLLFQRLGINKLILDLSNNSGGVICLAIALTALFDPHPQIDQKQMLMPRMPYRSVFRMNSLFLEIAKAAVANQATKSMFHPSRWLNPNTLQPFTAEEWMTQTRNEGAAPPFQYPVSQYLLDNCPSNRNNPLGGLKLTYAPADVAVLTNGYCGSSCAMVSAYMQEVFKAKTLVLGSRYGPLQVPPPYSFAGGQVISSSRIVQEAKDALGDNATNYLTEFPTRAEFLFTFRQIYSNAMPGVPLEYSRTASNILLLQTPETLHQPIKVYFHAAYMVGWRDNNALKRCMMIGFSAAKLLDRGQNPCRTSSIIDLFLNVKNMIYGIETIDGKQYIVDKTKQGLRKLHKMLKKSVKKHMPKRKREMKWISKGRK
jgi:hypothetical protein